MHDAQNMIGHRIERLKLLGGERILVIGGLDIGPRMPDQPSPMSLVV
jgi:hypothetical protein